MPTSPFRLLPDLRRLDDGDKVTLAQLESRLEVCEPCTLREGNRCREGRALDVEDNGFPGQAQFKREQCPRGLWPGELPDCIHLGAALTKPELAAKGLDTSTCGCAGKIRRCDEHGLCTISVRREGMACCDGGKCPEYEAKDAPVAPAPVQPTPPEVNLRELSAQLREQVKERFGITETRVEVIDKPPAPEIPRNPRRSLAWAVGLTAVPERRASGSALLAATSLRAAGFDRFRIFVDGERSPEPWEDTFGQEVTCRWPRVRAYGSWWLAAHELFIRNPLADLYAIFQDDVLAVRNLRQYLERCPPPESGYGNLYLHAHPVQAKPPNRPGWFMGNQRGKGALGLVFPRPAFKALLASAHMAHRAEPPPGHEANPEHRGTKALDGAVVDALRKEGFSEWVHNPSLLQHQDRESVIGNARYRPAPSFPGEDFDALSLLPPVDPRDEEIHRLRMAIAGDQERLRQLNGHDEGERARLLRVISDYQARLERELAR